MVESNGVSEDKAEIVQAAEKSAVEVDQEELPPLTFLQVLSSTFSAALGVQKKENKVRDFTRGKILHFILAGVIFTACFIGVIVSVVVYVLS